MGGKRQPKRRVNTLNDLSPKAWIKFQKSWFVHNPPRREDDVLLHPAKFPEDLVQEFIGFFTKRGERVLDPMVGTGSTLLACLASGREGVGVELLRKYADITRERLRRARKEMGSGLARQRVICGDARALAKMRIGKVHYCITSPPYWDMLRRKGFETQQERREAGLDVSYSDDSSDLGNIEDYEAFLDELEVVYAQVYELLDERRYLTIIVKNVKKGGRIYPLAWDLARRLSRFFALKDEKIWCQDNQRLAPYGMYSAWVSNTMHHYCLNFRKE